MSETYGLASAVFISQYEGTSMPAGSRVKMSREPMAKSERAGKPLSAEDAMPPERVIAIADFRAALRKFVRHSERMAQQHGLTPQRHLLLLMIKGARDGSERLTVGEAAERLQLSGNTTTELIDRAEASGLVRRERSGDDGRVVYLRLTREGERRLEAILRSLDADRQQLQEALQSLNRSFRRMNRP
jgi:DNA-binding MarR family transcriptional regulator